MKGWYLGGDYDDWKTTEPEPRNAYEDECAKEEALLERGERETD